MVAIPAGREIKIGEPWAFKERGAGAVGAIERHTYARTALEQTPGAGPK